MYKDNYSEFKSSTDEFFSKRATNTFDLLNPMTLIIFASL